MGDIKPKLVSFSLIIPRWSNGTISVFRNLYTAKNTSNTLLVWHRSHRLNASPPWKICLKRCLRTLWEHRLWCPFSGRERADVEWISPPGGCFNDSCTVRRAALVGRGQRKCIIVIEILYKHRGKSPAGLLAVRVINYVSFPTLIKSCEYTLLRV